MRVGKRLDEAFVEPDDTGQHPICGDYLALGLTLMRIQSIVGLVFRDSRGNEFGRIRELGGPIPNELQTSPFNVFAEDESGNYFVMSSGSVGFWDHETREVTVLASSESEFLAGISSPSRVSLNPEQVRAAWLDPTFAASFGAIKPREP